MHPPTEDDAFPERRATGEALALAFVFGLAYAGLALMFFHRTPHLFVHLDQLFDSDLGLWTIDLARPQGPHTLRHSSTSLKNHVCDPSYRYGLSRRCRDLLQVNH